MFNDINKYDAHDGNNAMPTLTVENCSNYFLLYLDNELTTNEKTLVETFIETNANGKKIFDELKLAIQPIDTTTFADKLQLFQYSNISIENFEEKVILTIDNELSEADQADVKSFAIINHLKDDFQALAKAKLLPNTNLLFDKNTLLKINDAQFSESTTIADALLLKLDNELSTKQAVATATIIDNNVALKSYYQDLKKSKLKQEAIIFPNKERLYKTERKPIFYLPIWSRVAAVLLIAFTIGYNLLNTKKADEAIVAVKKSTITTPAQLPLIDSTNKANLNKNLVQQNNESVNNNILQPTTKDNLAKVNNELNEKNNVTILEPQRNIIDSTTVAVLSNDGSNISFPTASVNLATTIPQAQSNVSNINNIAVNALLNQAKLEATYIVMEQIESSNDISILNIPISKIDKESKIAATSSNLKTKLAKKINQLQAKGITVGGYEIGFAKNSK